MHIISRTLAAIAALGLLLCTGCNGNRQDSTQAEESSAVVTTTNFIHPEAVVSLRIVIDTISPTELTWHVVNTLQIPVFYDMAFTLEKLSDARTPEPIPEIAKIDWIPDILAIEPESQITGLSAWRTQYGKLPAGNYRFTKVFYLDDHRETPLTLHVDFTIPEL